MSGGGFVKRFTLDRTAGMQRPQRAEKIGFFDVQGRIRDPDNADVFDADYRAAIEGRCAVVRMVEAARQLAARARSREVGRNHG